MTTPGMPAGAFSDPSQFNWTLTSSPDPSGKAAAEHDFQVKDAKAGTPQNVLLSKEGELVSLHRLAGHIGFQPSLATPFLSDLSFEQIYDIFGGGKADKTATMLQLTNLLDGLSDNLKKKLEADHDKPIAERDPDLHSLDLILQFAAKLLSITNRFSSQVDPKDPSMQVAKEYQELPAMTGKESMVLTQAVLQSYENYVNTLGSNHASFNNMMSVLTEFKRLMG